MPMLLKVCTLNAHVSPRLSRCAAPLSSYILFGNANRAKVKAEHPDWGIQEIAKELGVRWKALSESEKAEYESMQKDDKKRYV